MFAVGFVAVAFAFPPKIFAAAGVVCVAAGPPKMLVACAAAGGLDAGLPKIDGAADACDENAFEVPNALPEKRPPPLAFSDTFGLQIEKSLKIEPTSPEVVVAGDGVMVGAAVDGVPKPLKIEPELVLDVAEAKLKVVAGDATAIAGWASFARDLTETIAGVVDVAAAVGVPNTLLPNGDAALVAAVAVAVAEIPNPLKIDDVSDAGGVTVVVVGGFAVEALPNILAGELALVVFEKLKDVIGDAEVATAGVVIGFAGAVVPNMLAGELPLVAVAKLKVVTGDVIAVVAAAAVDAGGTFDGSDVLTRLIGAAAIGVDVLDENTKPVLGDAIEATGFAGIGAGFETSNGFDVVGVVESNAFTMLGDSAASETFCDESFTAGGVAVPPKSGIELVAWPNIVSGFGAGLAELLVLGVSNEFCPKPKACVGFSAGTFSLSATTGVNVTAFSASFFSFIAFGGLLNENTGLSTLAGSGLKTGRLFSATGFAAGLNVNDVCV